MAEASYSPGQKPALLRDEAPAGTWLKRNLRGKPEPEPHAMLMTLRGMPGLCEVVSCSAFLGRVLRDRKGRCLSGAAGE